jgi:(p)ppGpp synthase/HD superfamily hydrolase
MVERQKVLKYTPPELREAYAYLQKAIQLATIYHNKQTDKGSDVPYILHPMRVMLHVDHSGLTEVEYVMLQCVCIMHDLIEDTDVAEEDLERVYHPDIVDSVVAMTKIEGESYEDYIERVRSNELARRAKLADLRDNMSLGRGGPFAKLWMSKKLTSGIYRRSHNYLSGKTEKF